MAVSQADFAMARAFLLIRLILVLVGGVAAAGATCAGGPPGDSGKKSGNTFTSVSYTHLTLPTNREV